jgi:Zn-dependent alcohol dehydrogenase
MHDSYTFTCNHTGSPGRYSNDIHICSESNISHDLRKLLASKGFEISAGKNPSESYLGNCVPPSDVPAYIALYQSGRRRVDKLMTDTLKLHQIIEGFGRMAEGDAMRQVNYFLLNQFL